MLHVHYNDELKFSLKINRDSRFLFLNYSTQKCQVNICKLIFAKYGQTINEKKLPTATLFPIANLNLRTVDVKVQKQFKSTSLTEQV